MRSSGGKNWSSSNTPSLRIGGLPTMPDERRQVERRAPRPTRGAIRFDSRMCSRLVSGSALDADQPEQPGHVALDLVADDLGVARVGRNLQRADDVDRHARSRARACRS